MNKPYFSVIVPFYNKEKTLAAALKSLLSQDFPEDDYEILAVDNNSTDGSAGIIGNYPRVKLLREERQNAYAARNTGIRNSAGIFLVFTDADVVTPKDWLSNIYSSVNKNGHDILIGWYSPAAPVKLIQLHSSLQSCRLKIAAAQKDPSLLTACAANLTIKKDLFTKEGPFLTGSNSEDMDFAVRSLEKGYKVGFEDNIEVKRNDIKYVGAYLLKNFLYGCSGALEKERGTLPAGKFKYSFLTLKFIFRHFPRGIGILLPVFSYLTGYFLGRARILNSKSVAALVARSAKLLVRLEG